MTLRALFLSFAFLLQIAYAPAFAADRPLDADASPDVVLDNVRARIDAIQKNLNDGLEDGEMAKLRSDALAAQAQADEAEATLAPQLTSVQARLTEIGAPVAGAREAADIAAQRSQLDASRRTLDAQVKLARLMSVEAGQVARQVMTMRRLQFQARLGERTAAILAKPFWSDLADDFPRDLNQLAPVSAELRTAATKTPLWVWAGVAAFILVVVGLRMWGGRRLIRFMSTRVPAGRLRRSLRAVAIVLFSVLVPGLMAQAVVIGIEWNMRLTDPTQALLGGVVALVCFAGYVAGVGNALIAANRPSWRLPPLLDSVASRLAGFPLLLALSIYVTAQSERLSALANAGLVTAVAINCITALLLGMTIAVALTRAVRQRRRAALSPEPGEQAAAAPLWLTVVSAAIWLVLAASLVCLLIGYVALGSFVVKQITWALIVLSSVYLINVTIDDVFIATIGSRPAEGGTGDGKPRGKSDNESGTLPLTAGMRDQAAVLLSGVARLLVIITAVVLLVAPFGEGPTELMQRAGQLHDGISIGEVQLRPAAVLQAIAVLALGLGGMRVLKHWLIERFLPTTSLDAGMRLSATTLFGYAGGVFAVALALSALGIGLERIAWVASALSVGIGFGLQAVVQNFVSGLILLAERPVKVGDWVALGGVEGDIRRINVRATEIQMGDRSTVIVPNSEFITKTVRNVTHANPLGLVQIKLPMPLDTDAEQVRALMLAAFEAHDDVLEAPAPGVSLDGIDASNLVFNATGFVSSPRLAYGVRSALLFEVLKRLREARITMSKPPTMLIGAPELSRSPSSPELANMPAAPLPGSAS
ncbi:DUF3772 domain-containing protein [soil metagenome]